MFRLKILFVDDEPNILSGLKRSLRPLRNEWEMFFANSGPEALQLLEKTPVDVVVSDMKMSPMDGASLLTEVMRRWPQSIRIILSGQSKKEGILRSFGCAHQYLPKPCDSSKIVSAIKRSNRVRKLIHDSQMDFMMKLSLLPSPSSSYEKLSEELMSDTPSMDKIVETISADVSISAKIIQLVNSSYYSSSKEICDIQSAIAFIGLDAIRPIAFLGNFLSFVSPEDTARNVSIEQLFAHSFAVAQYSMRIVEMETQNRLQARQAYSCGLLHDCGMLVLASNLGSRYEQMVEKSISDRRPLHDVEYEELGISHAEVGAYLLDLWGLPDPFIEAAAYHHRIEKIVGEQFLTVVAIHSADIIDVLVTGAHPGGITESNLNVTLLEKIGHGDSFQKWHSLCVDESSSAKPNL